MSKYLSQTPAWLDTGSFRHLAGKKIRITEKEGTVKVTISLAERFMPSNGELKIAVCVWQPSIDRPVAWSSRLPETCERMALADASPWSRYLTEEALASVRPAKEGDGVDFVLSLSDG
ncbi:MAG: hypothetical protein ABJF10_07395 [Chthoniobacter sp.]|uniref:hypothetical protein n=1 Tax=Chthoniobacter sp. TaxID=2510640 RepID=UPI0032ABE909